MAHDPDLFQQKSGAVQANVSHSGLHDGNKIDPCDLSIESNWNAIQYRPLRRILV